MGSSGPSWFTKKGNWFSEWKLYTLCCRHCASWCQNLEICVKQWTKNEVHIYLNASWNFEDFVLGMLCNGTWFWVVRVRLLRVRYFTCMHGAHFMCRFGNPFSVEYLQRAVLQQNPGQILFVKSDVAEPQTTNANYATQIAHRRWKRKEVHMMKSKSWINERRKNDDGQNDAFDESPTVAENAQQLLGKEEKQKKVFHGEKRNVRGTPVLESTKLNFTFCNQIWKETFGQLSFILNSDNLITVKNFSALFKQIQ